MIAELKCSRQMNHAPEAFLGVEERRVSRSQHPAILPLRFEAPRLADPGASMSSVATRVSPEIKFRPNSTPNTKHFVREPNSRHRPCPTHPASISFLSAFSFPQPAVPLLPRNASSLRHVGDCNKRNRTLKKKESSTPSQQYGRLNVLSRRDIRGCVPPWRLGTFSP